MNKAIEIESLTKEFDGLIAVDHASLNVEEGEIFGFLGPNGAGKTTAIKMLCTILNPTSGSAKVCGYDIVRQRDKVRECIGIVFQDPAIDVFLTGKENLDFHGRMYHMDRNTREKRIVEVLDLMDLKGRENIKIDYCSGQCFQSHICRRSIIRVHPPNSEKGFPEKIEPTRYTKGLFHVLFR